MNLKYKAYYNDFIKEDYSSYDINCPSISFYTCWKNSLPNGSNRGEFINLYFSDFFKSIKNELSGIQIQYES